ncbi:MAG: tetratricopeptide repeat protein [Bacteroidia bacterium]|jgi:peptidoglycan-associated lipoprotein|nr:tetratricopeptide repeat protein [Bacteroidia bacterium]
MKRIFVCLLLACSLTGYAQLRTANQLYERGQYAAAYTYYNNSKEKASKQEKALIYFRMAECSRRLCKFEDAAKDYGRAVKAGFADDKALLLQGDMLMTAGKYDEALRVYTAYQERVPSDPAGARGITSAKLAARWINEINSCWQVSNVKSLNTKESEFSPTWTDKKHSGIAFTAQRAIETNNVGRAPVDPISGGFFSDVFEARLDKKGLWSSPAAVNGEVNRPVANEGSSCIMAKGNRMYFTRSERLRRKYQTCHIYFADKAGANWGAPQMVDFGLDAEVLDNYNFRHPAISADGQVMVFTSDMPGNLGGVCSDLWVSHWDARTKTWGAPEHLGNAINTTGREGFPYIHDDGSLYFSSDGLPGLGGLDLFRAPKMPGSKWAWGQPENLRLPLNSPQDDFGILFDGLKQRGYFSSNREGGRGKDDIWSFEASPKQVQGMITDCSNKQPVGGAVITVTPSSGTAFALSSNADGTFGFTGRYATSYVLSVDGSKATCGGNSGYLSLPALQRPVVKFEVDSICSISTQACLTAIPPKEEIAFPAVLYKLASAELEPSSKDSLNYLYRLLTENPNMVIEIAAHTDSRGSEQANNLLSERRAQACVDYLVREKGIDPRRIVAKGYGELRPLKLAAGTALTEAYINTRPENEREALHQLNRRTVFRIIANNFQNNTNSAPAPEVKKGFFDDSIEIAPSEEAEKD